jgi:hypothetical protein
LAHAARAGVAAGEHARVGAAGGEGGGAAIARLPVRVLGHSVNESF